MRRFRLKKSRTKMKSIMLITLMMFIFAIIYIFFQLDSKILPSAILISHTHARNRGNIAIDTAVNKSIEDMDLSASDFLIDSGDNTNYFYANTVLINSLCSNISANINEEMKQIIKEEIKVPLGAAMGGDSFSGMGPEFTFKIRAAGETVVDYETSFEAVGINQTNFKVWANVDISVNILNPLASDNIMISRKIMLIDTVINGMVPDKYLDMSF